MSAINGVVVTGVGMIIDPASGNVVGFRTKIAGQDVDLPVTISLRDITAEQSIAPTQDMLDDRVSTFRVPATGARFVSDGTQLVSITGNGGSAITTDSNGEPALVMPGGRAPFPLTILAGTPVLPKVAGVWCQTITIDAGSDVAHPEILITLNCSTGGDPEAASTALMSARFASPADNVEVWMTGIAGAYSTGALPSARVLGAPLTLMHIGLKGGTTYTQASGSTVTGSQAALLTWDTDDNIMAFDVAFAPPRGTNGRYRDINVRGYRAAAGA